MLSIIQKKGSSSLNISTSSSGFESVIAALAPPPSFLVMTLLTDLLTPGLLEESQQSANQRPLSAHLTNQRPALTSDSARLRLRDSLRVLCGSVDPEGG